MAKKNFHQHLFRARYDATMSVARNDRTSVGQRAHETPWLGLESLEPRLLLSTTFTAVHTFGGGALPGDIQKVAFGDINNDGWTDALVSSQLFVNNNGQFGTSPSLKVGRANVLGDYDNDGWLDVFDYGTIGLHRNNQNGGFTNVSGILAPAQSPVHRSSALGDFNGDGFLDIYLGGYETQIGTNLPDTMMLSQDGTSFTTKWISPGLQPARGVTASDFDEDGDLDIYTSNYRLFPNGLWVNDGNANITDQASTLSATGDNSHTIGSAWGDMDNDGHLDLFVGNFSHPGNPPSMFLRNMGPSGGYAFQSMISLSGPDWQESYASPALADYDNDGDLDLFLTTVYSGDAARLYRNDGNWIFTNVTGQAGLGNIRVTYQAAWADVDNDGDLDLTTDGTLFRNDNNNANHWLKVRLEGDGNTVNRAAIGAQVRLFVGNETLTRQVEAGTGEGNQNDLTLHFGLGSHGASVQVEVTWPDGTTQTFHTAVDRTIDVASDVAFGAKLPYSEDFNDHSADAIRAEAGNWFVNQSQRYRGEADASGVAISLVQLADPLPERFSISAIMRGKKPPGATSINAFAIFDYQSPDSFKFAGPSFDGDSWQIGQVTSNQQQVLASWDENLSNNTDYSVDVVISNDLVTLSGDGVVKVSHEFAQSLAGGQVGIGTYEATAIFDDLNLVRLKDVPTNFDFGTQSSAVEKRFARTMTSDYTFTAGFGWLPGAVGLSALKRNSGTALEKDLVQLSMGTFEIEVDNGRYETTVHLGDTSKARDQMAVSLEGANVETIDTASGQIVAKSYLVDVTDGRLSLTLEDVGGADPLVSIVGLTLEPRDVGLVARFTFDQGTGTTAPDTSQQGIDHTAALVDNVAWNSYGLHGALSFDGNTDMVSVPNSADIDLGTHQTLTISAWFWVEDRKINSRKQVIYEQGSGLRGLNMYVFDGRLYVGGWNTPQSESNWSGEWISKKVASNTWHHVALVLNGGPTVAPNALAAYLDGTRFGRIQGSQLWKHTGIGIGHVNRKTRFHDGNMGSADGLRGMIDEVHIYNRALTTADVKQLSSEVLAGDPNAALVGYWSFDEGGGPTAYDSSPNGDRNDAAFVGDTFWTSAGMNGAVRFDGDGDGVALPDSADIGQRTIKTRTVTVWFRVDDASIKDSKQVIYEQGGRNRGLNIYVHNEKLFVGAWNRPSNESNWTGTFLTSDQIVSGQWHHVALVLSGNYQVAPDALHAYLDGTMIGSGDGSQLWSDTGPAGVGAVNGGGAGRTRFHDGGTGADGSAFAGSIDELRIYNRVLADGDIANFANADPNGGPDLLVERYDFGTSSSPVMHGFTAVRDDIYSAATGFGWMNGATNLGPTDSGLSDPLLSDSLLLSDGTFLVDVPNGTYSLTVHLGSMTDDHDPMDLFLEGSYVETVHSSAGQIIARTHRVVVTNGQLTLRLSNQGQQNPYASIAGLEIAQVKTFAQTFDLSSFLANFATVQTVGPEFGDFDHDGRVTSMDLNFLLTVLARN